MTTVFIAGSISIDQLHEKVRDRIGKIVSAGLRVVVGDADGADTSIQEHLHSLQAKDVIVYCTGNRPRNNVADWPVHPVRSKAKAGTRAYFTAKDLEMARDSDYGLMIWDCESTGTLSNVLELLREQKKSVVFINKHRDFVTVADRTSLSELLAFMSVNARAKAEEKIGLSKKLTELAHPQLAFGASTNPPSVSSDLRAGSTEPGEAIQADGVNMKLRSELMVVLKEHISKAKLSQSQAALVFGVSQPRISDLARGKVDLFGLDTLVNMAGKAGLRIEMRVSVDESAQGQASLALRAGHSV